VGSKLKPLTVLLAIGSSVLLAYLMLEYTQYAWLGVVVALPLFVFRPLRSFISGLVIGLATSFSLYLIYPVSKLATLSSIIGGVSGLPPLVAISLYPILFSLITALSSSLWSVMFSYLTRRGGPR